MKLIPVDRSRLELDQKCPRAYFYHYKYLGRGIERISLNEHLMFGSAVHRALEGILNIAAQTDELPKPDEVTVCVGEAASWFRGQIAARGLELEQEATVEEDMTTGEFVRTQADTSWLVNHYCDLLEGIVWGWCLVRLREFMQQYTIVDVEREYEMPIATPEPGKQLMFLCRLDVICRRRGDGSLVVVNFKTTTEAKQWWLEQWSTDQQTMSEVMPVEYDTGEAVAGVAIEGLLKGPKRVEYPRGSGQWHHASPLVWAWFRAGDGISREEWASRYEWTDETGSHRLGKGWQRTAASTFPGGIPAWLLWLKQHDPETLTQQFVAPPLVSRQGSEMAEWEEQVRQRELEVDGALEAIEHLGWVAQHDPLHQPLNPREEPEADPEALRIIMAGTFPKRTRFGNCIFPSKCPFYNCCWGTAGSDPMGSGLYQLRQPNHPKELELYGITQPEQAEVKAAAADVEWEG